MDSSFNNVLITFNCKNIKRSFNCVKSLCKSADVVCLQETWLLPFELPLLSEIDNNFSVTGKSSVNLSTGVLRGRPHGGVAILWRKSVFKNVSIIKCQSERIVAIKATTNTNCDVLVLSVYMPTDQAENLPLFSQCLGELSAIIEDSQAEAVFMLGDFNAHPCAPFGDELLNCCIQNNWICADIVKMGISSNSYTYVSEAHGCRRWLDHCIVTEAGWQTVTNVQVLHDIFWSDHYPLRVKCNLGVVRAKVIERNLINNKVIWGSRGPEVVSRYREMCSERLKHLDFPPEFRKCADGLCNDPAHTSIIDSFYGKIVSALSQSSIDSVGGDRKPIYKGKCVMGWNKHVSSAHRQARLDYEMYILYGKPSSGPVFDRMTLSRKIFKSRLKFCQNNQDQLKMDQLASEHSSKNFKNFWKGTKKLNGSVSLPACVSGASEPSDIANIFKDHFAIKSLLQPVHNTEPSRQQGQPMRITSNDVEKCIKGMKRGKSPGYDGLSIEHLQNAGVHVYRVLSLLYTFCMRHCYLPSSMTKTVVVPIVKNPTGDITDKVNYRPISLATVLAKVLDGVLERYLSKTIKLQDSQFGFRAGLSTESAILTVKCTAEYYVKRNTPVFACFLDLSKAFDLVSYEKLWYKLRETGVSAEIVNLLEHWYSSQRNVIRWGNTFSEEYSLECGVRQGGLTSPLLFNLFMDQLIAGLSSTHVGCHIDNVCVNNISYADDMVLLSPSLGGLRKLLHICEVYVKEHGLRYNEKKSEFLVFRGKMKRLVNVPPLLLNGVPLSRVDKFKYLGHFVTDSLSDICDIERERRALSTRGNMVRHRFARCTAEVKRTLFKAFCQTFYTSGLWFAFTKKAYNALRVVYNNIFRALFGLPRFCSASGMFADARVDDFHTLMRKKSASIVYRIRGSSNTVLGMIADRLDTSLVSRFTELHVKHVTL